MYFGESGVVMTESSVDNDLLINVELEPPLGDSLLDALAVACVACRASASVAVIHKATYLVRVTSRIFFPCTEPVVHLILPLNHVRRMS